jgi:hypothetical protein
MILTYPCTTMALVVGVEQILFDAPFGVSPHPLQSAQHESCTNRQHRTARACDNLQHIMFMVLPKDFCHAMQCVQHEACTATMQQTHRHHTTP